MFKVDENTYKISMNEGDFGIILNFVYETEEDSYFEFSVYDVESGKDDTVLLKKQIPNSSLENNKIPLELTAEEASKIPKGNHCWKLVQLIDRELKNTLFIDKTFKVDKGG